MMRVISPGQGQLHSVWLKQSILRNVPTKAGKGRDSIAEWYTGRLIEQMKRPIQRAVSNQDEVSDAFVIIIMLFA